nr:hypothetical protein [Mucilaginibacter sp. E4BP6]
MAELYRGKLYGFKPVAKGAPLARLPGFFLCLFLLYCITVHMKHLVHLVHFSPQKRPK